MSGPAAPPMSPVLVAFSVDTLRNAPDAMGEIRTYAMGIEKLFSDAMPVTYAAYIDAGRVAP